MLVWRHLKPLLLQRWQDIRTRYQKSEFRAFLLFRKACRSSDNQGISDAFWRWLDRAAPGDQVATLDQVSRGVAGEDFHEFIIKEGRARYGSNTPRQQEGRVIYDYVATFRNRLNKQSRKTMSLGRNSLNPRSVDSTSESTSGRV